MSQRKRCLPWSILMISITACGCGGSQPYGTDRNSSPGLVVEPVEIDFGKCRIGVALPFSAELRNHGQKAVDIAEVDPSCGCTRVEISGNHCEPGGRIILSGSIRGESKPGKFRHRITIREAGPAQKEHLLMLVGVVEPTIRLSPDIAVLTPSLTDGKEGETVLTVTNEGEETVQLQKPVRLPDGVTAEIEKPELKPKARAQVTLKVGPGQLDEIDAEAELPTSHPLESRIPLPVKIRPKEGIRVVPSGVRLGVVNKASLLNKKPMTIRLSGEGMSLVNVTKVKGPEFFQCELVPEQSGVALRCTVIDRFSGIDLKSKIELTLEFKSPKSPLPGELSLEIPVTGILTEE